MIKLRKYYWAAVLSVVTFGCFAATSSVVWAEGNVHQSAVSTLEKTNESSEAMNTDDEAIQRINQGKETLSDYTQLRIKYVKAENVDIIRQAVKEARDTKKADLEKIEISKVVEDTINAIKGSLNNVRSGSGQVKDYKLLQVVSVTESNLAEINKFIASKGNVTITKVREYVGEFTNALLKINAGTGEANDYEVLGIYGVNEILDYVNKAVLETQTNKHCDLNKEDIEIIVSETFKLCDLYSYINDDSANVNDYEYAGVTGVTENSVDYLNEVLVNNRYWTLTTLQKNVDAIIISLKNINASADTIDNYKALEIQGVTNEDITLVRTYVKTAKQAKGSDLTRNEINKEVEKVLSYLNTMKNINGGKAVVSDYNAVGISVVDNENIDFINSRIAGSNFTSKEKIQGKVNEIVNLYKAFLKINSGEATVDDYKRAGIVISRTDFLSTINEALKDQNYFTAEEVVSKVSEVVNSTVFEKINKGQATLKDYRTVGVNNISSQDLALINISLRGKSINTESQLKDAVNFALEVQLAYLKSEETIRKVNDGKAVVEDYDYLGIVDVNKENLWFIKADLKGKNLDNSEDIQNRVDEINKFFAYYQRINLGTASVDDYAAIKVQGVNKDNISYIDGNIKGSNFIKVEDVQAKVTTLAKAFDAFVKINKGTAEVKDYETVGVSKVKAENIIYVSVYTKNHDLFKVGDVQKIVDQYVNICDALARINAGVGTLDDYKVISASTVKEDNYIYVNGNIGRYKLTKVEDVRAKVSDIVVQYYTNLKIKKALDDFNLGNATVEEYKLIKVNCVTDENLKYVNAELKGKNYDDQFVIQDNVSKFISKCALIQKVDSGEGTLDDYNLLGITGVTESNIKYDNAYLKEGSYLTVNDIQDKVNDVASKYNFLVKINAGNADVIDYSSVGVSGVTGVSLDYANIDLKGKNCLTNSQVQSIVNLDSAKYEAFINIYAGKGTLSDYNTLGVSGVSSDNISWLNSQISNGIFVKRTAETIKGKVLELQTTVTRNIKTKGMAVYSYNGHWYTILDKVETHWNDAEAYAESLDGHLVTITSAEEQKFINETLLPKGELQHYALGIVREGNGWRNITGEKFTYSNWNNYINQEPNNAGGKENYVEMYNHEFEESVPGVWNDYPELLRPNEGVIIEWDDYKVVK